MQTLIGEDDWSLEASFAVSTHLCDTYHNIDVNNLPF